VTGHRNELKLILLFRTGRWLSVLRRLQDAVSSMARSLRSLISRSGHGMSVDNSNTDLGGDTTTQTLAKSSSDSSTTVVEKVTPLRVDPDDGRHDITWYVKWFATVIMIFAVSFRAVEEAPKIIDQSLTLVGLIGWFFVAYRWHDRALMLVNAVAIPIMIMAVLRWLFS